MISYGDGMVERVTQLTGEPMNLVLDTASVSSVLHDLILITDGDHRSCRLT